VKRNRSGFKLKLVYCQAIKKGKEGLNPVNSNAITLTSRHKKTDSLESAFCLFEEIPIA
jgi:hypothetical protein